MTSKQLYAILLWVFKVYLDKICLMLGDGVGPNINWVGVSQTKWDVYLSKSFNTCFFCFVFAHAFESVVESNGDVEAFGKAGGGVYFLLPRNLRKVQVVAGYRIRSLIRVE